MQKQESDCNKKKARGVAYDVRRIPVGVAQGDAEVPGNSQQCGAGDFDQSCDDDKDVDRRPAYDEDCNHHQDHAGDPTQIPVLLLFVCVEDNRRNGTWRRKIIG